MLHVQLHRAVSLASTRVRYLSLSSWIRTCISRWIKIKTFFCLCQGRTDWRRFRWPWHWKTSSLKLPRPRNNGRSEDSHHHESRAQFWTPFWIQDATSPLFRGFKEISFSFYIEARLNGLKLTARQNLIFVLFVKISSTLLLSKSN